MAAARPGSRPLPRKECRSRIFEILDSEAVGADFIRIRDHGPKPLLCQFRGAREENFDGPPMEEGRRSGGRVFTFRHFLRFRFHPCRKPAGLRKLPCNGEENRPGFRGGRREWPLIGKEGD